MISRLLLFNLPTPHTLHPTPYTPHPTPHNLHPTPHTPNPTSLVKRCYSIWMELGESIGGVELPGVIV
ncbi:MAG: hypothetical protein PX481_26205 [Microcystis sp. M53603_WE2]|uniref:hypothetical protein n=1 Tax=unclassified Microcystis TaxID=2643300 RepID=UPI0018AD2B0A|nr:MULTISPECIES: hypothetical protein [unclassified Microcystis]MCE2662956.1 hypothetical protein [Microcystis sp. 53602_E8]MCZ8364257.1 hypothetical protein [Microcystis sp. LE19-251.1A]MDJ0566749.1 hypothetical protein [Microcystis sp. M49629_WE12]MDJ0542102.1 hypothetical protein [Microcystis sp. M53603_WE2]MDJ0605575.1 hypothetical protein [Microcystis sp. M53602_WE12]